MSGLNKDEALLAAQIIDMHCFDRTGMQLWELNEIQKATEQEYLKMRKKSIQETAEKIPYWVNKGFSMIAPEKYTNWFEFVCTTAGQIYYGIDLDIILEIMEALNSDESLESAKAILANQPQFPSNGASAGGREFIRNAVKEFSNRGEEFYLATAQYVSKRYKKEPLGKLII